MRLGMKLTKEGPRAVGGDGDIDLNLVDPSLPTCLKRILSLPDGLERARRAISNGGPTAEGKLIAPIPHPGKVICIGLNYRDHAIEAKLPIPTEPVCFGKFTSAVIGPEDPVVIPTVSTQTDFEAELVVVIGKKGKNIPKERAMEHIAGYTNGNDISARDWQIGRPGGQWLLGKTADTFAPIGPYLITADEVGDPHNLRVRHRLNRELMQDSNTKEFIFTLPEIISHISKLFSLEPGDIMFTGTPPGVGMGRSPQRFLRAGDVCEVEIEHLGVLRNPIVSET